MELKDLGQLLQISLPQDGISRWKGILEEVIPGSIVIQGANVSNGKDIQEFIKKVQLIYDDIGIPDSRKPLIGITHEGGWISRIHDISNSPGNMALAATGSTEYTYSTYRAMGQELSSLGIDWNLAPTVDLNTNPENPIIGVRSFGDNPAEVSKHAKAACKGLRDAGLLACAKHFPGHGDTQRDSHLELPAVNKKLTEMSRTDLVPYVDLIKDGVDSIMISHIFYPDIGGDSKPIPASLSERVVGRLLRSQMGFDGLVVTDSLSMSAVAENFPAEQATKMAIKAGVDILECAKPEYYMEIFHSLQDSVKSREISANRIEKSLERFNSLKNILSVRKSSYFPWPKSILENVTSASVNASITILGKGKLDVGAIKKAGSLNSVFFTRSRLLEEEFSARKTSPVTEIIKSWGHETHTNLVLPRNLPEERIRENVQLLSSKLNAGDFLAVFLNDSTAYSQNCDGCV
ncbi:MAG: glycoside hydrolase family 3 protein, partial [Candidatus Thermoplasmatota archaeon]|nr:glycoside hydrolase family 3 protein [Candidatus Thermoplasmatota archaeon]